MDHHMAVVRHRLLARHQKRRVGGMVGEALDLAAVPDSEIRLPEGHRRPGGAFAELVENPPRGDEEETLTHHGDALEVAPHGRVPEAEAPRHRAGGGVHLVDRGELVIVGEEPTVGIERQARDLVQATGHGEAASGSLQVVPIWQGLRLSRRAGRSQGHPEADEARKQASLPHRNRKSTPTSGAQSVAFFVTP
jgi:hypothetical protein